MTKTCPTCKEVKPLGEFYCLHKLSEHVGEERYRSYCKPCGYSRWKAAYNPSKRKDWLLKTMYGITLGQYNQMLEDQEGVCAICKNPPPEKQPYLAVDHNHKTGEVRALLCGKCNMVVGGCNESVERLGATAEYLEHFNATT